ncbi:Formation of crista junctions protein 1 [Pseudocyphellaria aurata]|nr:Formation of crista junctions protein 1 [Pseudocyphellaria aurata]
MLRTALPMSRRLVKRPIGLNAMVQWGSKRCFMETRANGANTKPSIHDSDVVVLPGSQSQTATAPTPPPPGPVTSVLTGAPTPATPGDQRPILPEQLPLVPPPPPGGKTQTAPPTSIPPTTTASANSIPPATPPPPKSDSISSNPPASDSSPSPPPPSKRKRGRLFRFVRFLIILGGLSFAGGTYYSLLSDNFHDFFTEYIPFGEDAVLYFEEREFRKRFPSLTNPTRRPPPPDSGNRITIPSKSGVSWKISEEGNQGDGRKPKPAVENAQRAPSTATPAEKTTAVEKAKTDASTAPSKPQSAGEKPKADPPKEPEKPAQKAASISSEAHKNESTRAPEVNEPSRAKPIPRIDPLNIKDADEPLVQDLVKIVNDIILVVNSDNASGKYSSTIGKAKSALANVGQRILALKQAEKQAADQKIKSTQLDFDNAAKELVRRLEEEMKDQESRWRDEFESERETLSKSYQERLDVEVNRLEQLSEQRLRNQLLEQAIEMKKSFISDVQERVETERDGRLSKLSDLSSSINELEGLTSQWNSVLNANLKTQRLQVAVEAVRASLDHANRPRPFVHELAALKELGEGNPVVNAAIASINPTAYQRGVPTSAQLIDRFRRVAAEVRKASLLPEDAGLAAHAASLVLSRFMFKKKGRAVGDDVESVLTRTEVLLEEGDLDGAAREMNGLDGWAKQLSRDWIGEARRVLEVRQAVEVIGAEVRLQGLGID